MCGCKTSKSHLPARISSFIQRPQLGCQGICLDALNTTFISKLCPWGSLWGASGTHIPVTGEGVRSLYCWGPAHRMTEGHFLSVTSLNTPLTASSYCPVPQSFAISDYHHLTQTSEAHPPSSGPGGMFPCSDWIPHSAHRLLMAHPPLESLNQVNPTG